MIVPLTKKSFMKKSWRTRLAKALRITLSLAVTADPISATQKPHVCSAVLSCLLFCLFYSWNKDSTACLRKTSMWVWKGVEFGTCHSSDKTLEDFFFKVLPSWAQIADLRGLIHPSLAGTMFFHPFPGDWENHLKKKKEGKKEAAAFLSHHKRINVHIALWRCGVMHVLLLIINYRSASHHLKHRALPPWKNFYFNQLCMVLSPDPDQLQTLLVLWAGPRKEAAGRKQNSIQHPTHF